MLWILHVAIVSTEDVVTGVGQENGCGESERCIVQRHCHLQQERGLGEDTRLEKIVNSTNS